MWFSSPHGDFSFSISWLLCLESFLYGFRPLTGISLFLSITAKMHKYIKGFRPLTGISLFLLAEKKQYNVEVTVFVPSRGFLFFYYNNFKFCTCQHCFRPLTGISLFLWISFRIMTKLIGVFVPSRGFLFFYGGTSYDRTSSAIWFSSPHGDFSFSICITGNM